MDFKESVTPNNSKLSIAQGFLKSGRAIEAIETLLTIAETSRGKAFYWVLGSALSEVGRDEDALENLEIAKQLGADDRILSQIRSIKAKVQLDKRLKLKKEISEELHLESKSELLNINTNIDRTEEFSPLFVVTGDRDPRFLYEIELLLKSAEEIGNVSLTNFLVAWVGEMPVDFAIRLSQKGVTFIAIEAFHELSPHCNKIFAAKAALNQIRNRFSHLVIIDADMIFCRKVDLWEFCQPNFAACVVRKDNPPIDVLLNVLGKYELKSSGYAKTLVNGEITLRENLNGGLLSFPENQASKIISSWEKWAKELLQEIDLLEEWKIHIDQVSLLCALLECEISLSYLSDALNYPILPFARGDLEPIVLHYHRKLDFESKKIVTDDAFLGNFLEKVNEFIKTSI